jgi:arylsulfatase A-like enzyme
LNTPVKPSRPNVIWVFGDQHRAQAQSHMGDPNVNTPHMDRLAAEGVSFTNAVAGCPWCTPFRGSLLTSRYIHENVWKTPQRMDEKLPVITDVFNDAGYDTAYFGKWHLDGTPGKEHPPTAVVPRKRRGRFRTWIGYENNNSQYHCFVHGHRRDEEIDLYPLPDYETDALTDLLIDYLDDRGDQAARAEEDGEAAEPFFAVLSVQPPHDPYVAPAEDMFRKNPARIELRPNVPPIPRIQEQARRDLAGYYAMIENLDWNLGRIRAVLDDTGLADETYIIFFSDHGDMHGSHGYWRKSSPWEESIRIPFTIGGGVPYNPHRNARVDPPINHVDIAPTTLGLCGIDPPDWMRGFNYAGYFDRSVSIPLDGEPDAAYLQHHVRKYHATGCDRQWRGIVTRDGWKYVCIPEAPYVMFNLNEDPYELHNLAVDPHARGRRAELHEQLASWIERTGDEFPLPEP